MPISKLAKRLARQQQIHDELSVLPSFSPLNEYEIVHIHRWTPTRVLHDLIGLARTTTQFTMDTEHDFPTHRPALIQIEFVRRPSIIVLIQICHLPHSSSVLFWLISSMLRTIIRSSNSIFSWGCGMDELAEFVGHGLFTEDQLRHMNNIDVQERFRQWFDAYATRDSFSTKHAPKHCNDKWSLQRAIAVSFNERLDKCCTLSKWSVRLDHGSNNHMPFEHRLQDMIQYAAYDCLAVTRLVQVLCLHDL